jgi:hypothetical protein
MQNLTSTVLKRLVQAHPTVMEIIDCIAWLAGHEQIIAGFERAIAQFEYRHYAKEFRPAISAQTVCPGAAFFAFEREPPRSSW